jgi:DNA replicative helicase MCM subunit Mcm2 (Cdc46/Mcm family)
MPIETTEQYKKSKIAPVMETRGSKFCKFQEARIQEMADEVSVDLGCSTVPDL